MRSYAKEMGMPLVNVKVIEGVFSAEQKRQMVCELTEAMVRIEGENMRAVTWVVVEEVGSGDWGIGGKPMTTEDVRALAAGENTAGRETDVRPAARLEGVGDGR
jgi:4-oxalocrotonate tautomerase